MVWASREYYSIILSRPDADFDKALILSFIIENINKSKAE